MEEERTEEEEENGGDPEKSATGACLESKIEKYKIQKHLIRIAGQSEESAWKDEPDFLAPQ